MSSFDRRYEDRRRSADAHQRDHRGWHGDDRRRHPGPSRRVAEPDKMAPGVRTGRFARRLADKGFGFIVDDESGVDVFFHLSDYRPIAGNPRFEDLLCDPLAGAKMIFEAEQTDKGWRARGVYAR